MTKNKIKKSLSLIAVSAATALSLVGMSITPSTFVSAGQQLGQTDFENGVGLPWHVCESAPGKMEFEISGGVYKITIVNPGGASKGGEDRWDCQFRHRGLTIVSGNTYKVSFEITASNDCTYYTKIGDMAEPFAEDWHGEPDPSQHEAFWNVQQLQANQTKKVEGTFTANRTAEVEWAFHIGGDTVPEGTVFTFDNMSLECTTSDEYDYQPEEEWVRSDILTNQLGYFPQMNKKATLLSDSTSPVKFELKDSGGQTVYEGESEPKGLDADSIDNVHELDFSDYDQQGTYYIEAEDGAKSREFQIGNGEMYSYMLYDSLNYFYHPVQRSGTRYNRSRFQHSPRIDCSVSGPLTCTLFWETCSHFRGWSNYCRYHTSYHHEVLRERVCNYINRSRDSGRFKRTVFSHFLLYNINPLNNI